MWIHLEMVWDPGLSRISVSGSARGIWDPRFSRIFPDFPGFSRILPDSPRFPYLAVVWGVGIHVHGGQEVGNVDPSVPVDAGQVQELLPGPWGQNLGFIIPKFHVFILFCPFSLPSNPP